MSHAKNVFTFKDRSSETSSISVQSEVLDIVNFDLQGGLRTTLEVAINALSLGLQCKREYGNVDILAPSSSNSATGQRELKLEVSYHDTVTFETFTTEIPVADEAVTLLGEDNIDPTDANWIAFKAAYEAFALSPDPRGNAVIVDGGRIVGRTL